MYWLLVSSMTSFVKKLLATLTAWVFDSFIYCPLVFNQISLLSCLIVTFASRVFDSFMYCPLVFIQIVICSCLIVTFATRVFDPFMYCPLSLFLRYESYLKLSSLSKPQLNNSSTSIEPKLGLTRKLLCTYHHLNPPHKLNVSNISAFTGQIFDVVFIIKVVFIF